jgi:hypothetical protein
MLQKAVTFAASAFLESPFSRSHIVQIVENFVVPLTSIQMSAYKDGLISTGSRSPGFSKVARFR